MWPPRIFEQLPYILVISHVKSPNITKQFSLVQSLGGVRLCDPMDCCTPGFPVCHQLPELAQTLCPSSWWCHPAISSSVIPFSSCLPDFAKQLPGNLYSHTPSQLKVKRSMTSHTFLTWNCLEPTWGGSLRQGSLSFDKGGGGSF